MNIFNFETRDLIFPLIVYESDSEYERSLKFKYLNNSKVMQTEVTNRIESLRSFKVENILLFGVPKKRDINSSESFNKKGVIQNSIRNIKSNFGSDINLISDVCVCQYNLNGHCGLIKNQEKHGFNTSTTLDNDKSLELLGKIALSLSESGTDFIAPSSMMDGQVWYLKNLLVESNFTNVKIMSYSAKQNSSLYSPFRHNNYFENSNLDKASYQSSYFNPRESVREALLDIEEGSDWIMVKPSYWYMDIIKHLKEVVNIPIVTQNVSGEYVLINNYYDKTDFDQWEYLFLLFQSLKRSGVDKIISYFLVDWFYRTQLLS